MRANDIRELSVEEVKTRIAELEEERFRLNFRSATEPLRIPSGCAVSARTSRGSRPSCASASSRARAERRSE